MTIIAYAFAYILAVTILAEVAGYISRRLPPKPRNNEPLRPRYRVPAEVLEDDKL